MTDLPGDLFEEVSTFLPKYLTPEQKEDLFVGLKDFPENMQYFLQSDIDIPVMQGDALTGLTVINFHTIEKKVVRGLVLSNTCDIVPENERDTEIKITFVPLVSLARFRNFLLSLEKTEQQVDDQIQDIKLQKLTSTFYIPGVEDFHNGDIAFFDDVHTIPLREIVNSDCHLINQRLARLSMMGFYVLLMKIAIHFCRFQENVPRFA